MAKKYQNTDVIKFKKSKKRYVAGHAVKHARKTRWIALAIFAGIFLAITSSSIGYYAINSQVLSQRKYIVEEQNIPADIQYGIVFGSGIRVDKKPYDELKARLDVAGKAFKDGKVQKLLLTGDNRTLDYNEPTVMKNYLIDNFQIPSEKLQEDFAGRSTYESCERAIKIFSIKKAVLFSAHSHLPRAIYTCRHFGVEAFGVSSGVEAANYKRREPLAILKMYFNLYIRGEDTILGEPIQF